MVAGCCEPLRLLLLLLLGVSPSFAVLSGMPRTLQRFRSPCMCSADQGAPGPEESSQSGDDDPAATREQASEEVMDDSSSLSGDDMDEFSSSVMSVLSTRLAKAKQQTAEDKLQSMVTTAANWRSGRCAQRAVVVLDEWIRRLDCQNDVLACGTYSGDVQLVDVESGDLLETWYAEQLDDDDDDDEVEQEITAIQLSEDAELVLSGDAAGYVMMYRRGVEAPMLRASHGASVTGVHWDGASGRAYSTGFDKRFICHDVEGGGAQ